MSVNEAIIEEDGLDWDKLIQSIWVITLFYHVLFNLKIKHA